MLEFLAQIQKFNHYLLYAGVGVVVVGLLLRLANKLRRVRFHQPQVKVQSHSSTSTAQTRRAAEIFRRMTKNSS